MYIVITYNLKHIYDNVCFAFPILCTSMFELVFPRCMYWYVAFPILCTSMVELVFPRCMYRYGSPLYVLVQQYVITNY